MLKKPAMKLHVFLFCLTGIIISSEAIVGVLEDFPMLNTLSVCEEDSKSSFISCSVMLRINMVSSRGFLKGKNFTIDNNSTCVYLTNENSTDPKQNPRCLVTGSFSPSGGAPAWEPVVFHFFNRKKGAVGVPCAMVYYGTLNDPRKSTVYTPMSVPNNSTS